MDLSDNQQNNTSTTNDTTIPGFTPPPDFNPAAFSSTSLDDPSTTAPLTTQPAVPVEGPNDSSLETPVADSTPVTPVTTPDTSESSDDLLSIKQDALAQLSPLVEHLDQTPEEKFRTTMMLIQATDDQTRIKDAYAAAKEITDKKAQAQAFLDVVNEINYFTQQNKEA